ncbi:metalloregulator ArsR/SmtB family transcription factor [Bittarella massiliensis]|uniref:metalloregulator ArsR/SmtB family transcription factor n=1 Tax=Bittarella massiliensis (ex Durand et al. 2017) TaxID=1720313 RepID=UPI0013684C63|nr:metalloregulator ArsR/SmtB family transcription factor [Bittarella massiliensis (ex Durand et al. 2017)]MZL81460.1 metalloregulator ArsR/SmtB family transcription factor [Bittarella massiliensis (ex Durand et al. 2017)]
MGLQETMRALADPTRREILELVRDRPLPAGEIAVHFACSGAAVSPHLSVLRAAGLCRAQREGTYIYYQADLSVVEELLHWAAGLTGRVVAAPQGEEVEG